MFIAYTILCVVAVIDGAAYQTYANTMSERIIGLIPGMGLWYMYKKIMSGDEA